MNILLTSVGRRGYLVDYFKEALDGKGSVIAANSDEFTTGMIAADKAYKVPRVDSKLYIDSLLDICKKENVSLVLSLFDIDLPYLSANKERFEELGVRVVVSDEWLIDIANDKWKTYNFFCENGYKTPETFISLDKAKNAIAIDELQFPLIVKPRWGMGSIAIYKVENLAELDFFYFYVQKQIQKSYLNILSDMDISNAIVIQEYIEGEEYNLDILNNFEGENFQIIAKKKIAMRSGETDVAEIVDLPVLDSFATQLATSTKHIGNMDVDVLKSKSGDYYFLEMNARFGGGYPFSHLAGANFPQTLIKWHCKESTQPFPVRIGCVGLKAIKIVESA